MIKKIVLFLAILLVGFLSYVAMQPDDFNYERNALISATPDKVYPYLSNFKLGSQWNPYERIDPTMKITYSGPDSGVGAKLSFAGKAQTGTGNLEILKAEPNSLVEIRLEMIKPMKGVNTVLYKLTPEGYGTRFSWSMYGKANFLSKLMGVIIDCDKMMGEQFEQGFKNLNEVLAKK